MTLIMMTVKSNGDPDLNAISIDLYYSCINLVTIPVVYKRSELKVKGEYLVVLNLSSLLEQCIN